MRFLKNINAILLLTICAFILVSSPIRAQVNDSEHGFLLRGGLGAGRNLWGYVDHGNSSGDVGTGKGYSLNLAAMYNYTFFAVEGNYLYVTINDLEWEDTDNSGVKHDYKSTGTGHMTIFDLKLGAKLFTSEGDMGYTYFYGGLRFWQTERDQDTLEDFGTKISVTVNREAKGNGWIFGFRDFSTFGPDNGAAFALQTGLFYGKAPVDEMKTNGAKSSLSDKANASLGFELGAGLAMQNMGFSILGLLKLDVNVTTFDDPAATGDDESVFAFGIWHFQVEMSKTF